jgi:hypothetical protein
MGCFYELGQRYHHVLASQEGSHRQRFAQLAGLLGEVPSFVLVAGTYEQGPSVYDGVIRCPRAAGGDERPVSGVSARPSCSHVRKGDGGGVQFDRSDGIVVGG